MGTTADKLTYLAETKKTIKDAIVAKGVDVPDGTSFRQYADKVGEIESGSAQEYVTGYNDGAPPMSDTTVYYVHDAELKKYYNLVPAGGPPFQVDKNSILYVNTSYTVQVSGGATPIGYKPVLAFFITGDFHIGIVQT